MIAPEFHNIEATALPNWSDGAAQFKLIAGEGFGKKSSVPTYSPFFMVEVKTTEGYDLVINNQLRGEIGIWIVAGSIEAFGQVIEKGNIVVSKIEDTCAVRLEANTHLLLFGGQPLPEERHINWNFVSSDPEKIEAAKAAWAAKTFPMMSNDDSYVPLPTN